MLMVQLWLAPQLSGLGGEVADPNTISAASEVVGGIFGGAGGGEEVNLDRIFFFFVIIQGFFSGLAVGKFSEGTLKNGVMHSFILIVTATLIITLIKGGI